MNRLKHNLQLRASNLAKENNKRNLSRLNKRSYYGIGTEVKGYEDLIFETFYDEKKFKEILNTSKKENLSDDFSRYLNEISVKWVDVKDKIEKFFLDSFEKGGRRVYDRDGNALKIGEIEDTRGAQFLLTQQEAYFKNLTERQSQTVLKTINKGMEKGLSEDKIAEEIQGEVKNLTKSRAKTIARTELVKAHNQGQVQLMKEVGAKTYNYIHSQDSKVCKTCKKHQGSNSRPRVYEVKNAGNPKNPLPVLNSHPNCRCSTIVHSMEEEL